MKKFLLIASLLVSIGATGQVKKVNLQASGLTCSMCSNAINKALKSVDFVDRIESNIKNSTFEIYFKPGKNIDFDVLKKKIENAGFFVASFFVTYHFNDVKINNNDHAVIGGKTFMFLNVKDQQLNGDKIIRIIDKGFLSLKEFKKNNELTHMACYKTGVAESCCDKDKLVKGVRIYHATI